MARKLLLKALIADRFAGSQAEFARAIKRSPAQVNQWLTGNRALGDAGARTIELALELPAGYFDQRLSYAKAGNILAMQLREPQPLSDIEEVARLMQETDDRGRAMALAAVRVALSGYTPAAKNSGN